ncbi:MAG: FtsL-like putative cell division protein [Flavobacterium sp.]
MKVGIYDVLKAKFLIDEHAAKNWRFLMFLILLAIIMINNIHRYESKVYKMAHLNKEVKELRSEFIERKSELMKLKMESTITQKMESRGIQPSTTPPVKIKVLKSED